MQIGDYKAKMERRDVGNSIVEIRHMTGSDRQTTKTDRWLVVKKTLDASHISSQVSRVPMDTQGSHEDWKTW